MNMNASIRFMCMMLAVIALPTSCSRPDRAPVAAEYQGRAQFQNVRFGPKAGELLVTACRGGEPETCTLTLARTERQDATEYTAPAGYSIKDASIVGDAVLAVVIRQQADKNGNHPSAIVSFSPGRPVLAVRRRDTVQMRFPVETDGRLMFWRRECLALTDRYCQHDLFEQTGPTSITPVGGVHRFAEVDTIVPQQGEVVINAGYPADGVADSTRYLEYAGSTRSWLLAPAQQFGLARLASGKDVLKAMMVPGGLLLLAQDEDGIALFRQMGHRVERVAGLPPATEKMAALVVRDVAVSSDGGRIAMIVGSSDIVQPATLFTYDPTTRKWEAVDPAALTARHEIVLKE